MSSAASDGILFAFAFGGKGEGSMGAKKILFPTDFSAAAIAALAEAKTEAKVRGATLIVLHVQESTVYDADLRDGRLEPNFELLDRMFNELKPNDDQSIPVVYRFSIGDPATEILRTASDEDVDMIVMGTRGRSGLPRWLMGSVAETVIRHATCPVLTFKRSTRAAPPSIQAAV
jgi:universal stress protein A